MQSPDPSRREFTKWAAAALGGLAAGLSVARVRAADTAPGKKDPDKPLLLQEPHVCRGLGSCKGEAKGGKNACAGQGDCATAKAHVCKTHNDCAGLGGCGENPGENKCKGMGGCEVPLKKEAWAKARANYEAAMKKAGKTFGDAPKP